MEKLIPQLYREYGTYVNTSKMIPSVIDGLIPVQRRILLTLHTVARNGFVKTSKVLGECMARWHPHSEALGTAEWAVQNEFALGDGQWGSDIGIEKISCAAPRYTKIKANPEIESMAFSLVRYVPWEADEMDPEPIYVPTMLPFCLMAQYELNTIAFGFKCDIPTYNRRDLVKRLFWLLSEGLEQKGKRGRKKQGPVIKPFVKGCHVVSDDRTCHKLLTSGKADIEVKGIYEIDEKKNVVYVRGWSPRTTFQSLLTKIDRYNKYGLLSNSDIGWIDQSTRSVGTKIKFEVTRGRNIKDTFHKMVEAIDNALSSTHRYHMLATNGGEVFETNVDEMLLTCYQHYKQALENFLQSSIDDLKKRIEEIKVIQAIRPHIPKVVKGNKPLDQIYSELAQLAKVSKDAIERVCSKYEIRRLLSTKTDIDILQNKLQLVEETLANIDAELERRYKEV